jgi:ADP-ribose pyrophosphatase
MSGAGRIFAGTTGYRDAPKRLRARAAARGRHAAIVDPACTGATARGARPAQTSRRGFDVAVAGIQPTIPIECPYVPGDPPSVSRQTRFEGKIVSVVWETVTLPNGKQPEIEIVRHPGGAAAVALDDKGRVCLLRQYRPVFRDWIWELPAGKLDPGEDALATAQRELIEEAGVKAERWRPLGGVYSSPGVFSETVYLYLAEELTAVPSAAEEHELFEVHWLPLEDALARAADGDINDGKTVAGLFRASRRRKT